MLYLFARCSAFLLLTAAVLASGIVNAQTRAPEPGAAPPSTPGQRLFGQHCAGCHGVGGDGIGPAAAFLFPKPRNLLLGKYKLVSTANSVPSEADLEALLVRGMPGSAMPAWGHLSREDRAAIIGEVYRLTAIGARERYIANLKAQQGLTDEEIKAPDVQEEIAAYVKSRSTAGTAAAVPAIAAADAAAIARGREHYVRQGCVSCHGEQGKGDGVKKMQDDDGTPTRPRDLTRGIYKGGHDPASLFLRVARGMPGTPMPSAPLLKEAETVDLVHFLRSLSTEEQRQSVVIRRRQVVARRVNQLPAGIAASQWLGTAVQSIQTVPLWWRDDAEAGLEVQAAHDGQTLALRLSWQDGTPNTSAVHADEFEDMAAVQLYHGGAEPFLGMGTSEGVTDLSLWRGGRQATGSEDSLLDDYPFDTPVYRDLFKGKPLPDYITARAAGNQVAVRDTSAQQLSAKGPGSSTFLPRPSQTVTAVAAWEHGKWTVVLKRPLISPDSGLVLAAGQSCSLSVALWDGAVKERGGQKQISVWNDLKLE